MEEYIEPVLADVLVVSYEGGRDDAGRMSGKGSCTIDNGCTYDGGFKDGLFSGDGVFVWSDGTTYEGTFLLGQMEGKGTYKWPDGSSYTG